MYMEELPAFLAVFVYGLYAEKLEKRRYWDDLLLLLKH
jgi:hypothetical protein